MYNRDKGICAHCGIDTVRELTRILSSWLNWVTVEKMRDKAGKTFGYAFKDPNNWFNCVAISHHHAKRSRHYGHTSWASTGLGDKTLRGLCVQIGWAHLNTAGSRCLCKLCQEAKVWQLPRRSTLWDADHIVPVADGGGECGLENYQTLCIQCHNKKSAKQRRDYKKTNPSRYRKIMDAIRRSNNNPKGNKRGRRRK